MQLDGKEWTIISLIVGWFITVWGIGRAFGGLVLRVETLEKNSNKSFVSEFACVERRQGCSRENKIQFDHGSRDFVEVKKMIADNDKASHDRHTELMRIILSIQGKQ